jgi:hypothetical protein
MGGTSYTVNPLETLRIVAASSIFGEPSYYRGSHDKESMVKTILRSEYGIRLYDDYKNTTVLFTEIIDKALAFDFGATLALAVKLRKEYFMRLNPAVILVRAAIHPSRSAYTQKNPGQFGYYVRECSPLPNDLTNEFEYYMWLTGSKAKLPNILKNAWRDRLVEYSKYQLAKYKSKFLIDLSRISHVKGDLNPALNELMKTGNIVTKDDESTWEKLRSAGKNWKEILTTIKMPHMALLRNLRNIAQDSSVDNLLLKATLEYLKEGVISGKQFPYRYYTAFNIADKVPPDKRMMILDALQECMDIAIANFPKLTGKTISLTDNSGSAWGALTTEYGTVRVAEIANLSGVMTAVNSDEGYVGVFGDRLTIEPISKRDGILTQHKKLNAIGKGIGGNTENGIWLFFKEALEKKESYDNIFIYSDMQAGQGGLYGINASAYKNYTWKGTQHIDVLKLVQEYRKQVNPKVNVYSVQVAGYDNSVLPDILYRGALLTGWTGNEVVYAKEINDFWDTKESQESQKQFANQQKIQ